MAPVIGIFIIWIIFLFTRWVIWPRFPSIPTALIAWTPVVAGPLILFGDGHSFNPGLLLMALGAGSNAAVVVVNGGKMPIAGKPRDGERHRIPISSKTRLSRLGDWIPLFRWERFLISPGDIILTLGILVAVTSRLLERG